VTKLLKTRLADEKTRGYDLVLIGCFQREEPEVGRLPRPIATGARRAAGRTGWRGETDQTTTVPIAGKHKSSVTLRGLGRRSALGHHELQTWIGKAVAAAAADGFRKPLLVLPLHETTSGAEGAQFVVTELALSGYRFDSFLKKSSGVRLRNVRVLPPRGHDPAYREGWKRARKTSLAIGWARDLANTPPNVATPEWMAEQARELAASRDMKIEILEPADLEERGMGGILAVGGGSANPPRLVRLEWGSGERSVSLVGKGVTFDTGGISIKPAASMDEMKFDKSGACTVLGIAQGAADLELPYHFRVYLPLAENMPDGKAYRPGDIVRCYNGKTVEILNTDAEGRMILADALSWAAEEKPDSLLDYATLTGACVVALGQRGAGLFSHDDTLAEELLGAADAAHEYLWRLPLWPEFGEQIKGQHGDLKNVGVRWGGANTAAAFLSNFVAGAGRWAHLDIAGPAYVERGNKASFGATGYGVALTLSWLRRMADSR
jgi:leucyl aminopeptidase